ncbi:hypothetical protein [Glaciihabitans sp. dw_435]|uniref:hypothetical protein n=1 Tax=Glaciihabitans sp. dw_435 TaxID=2720081 RepID=UPI001BD313B5|nr:hypothetical protein [Glaciihabitans sp. dw_435]
MSDPRNDSLQNSVSDDEAVAPNPFAVGFSEPTSGVVEIEDDLGPDALTDVDLDESDIDDELDDPVLDRPDRGDAELNEGDLDGALDEDDDRDLDDDDDDLDEDDLVLDEDDDEIDDDFDDRELDELSEPYELGTHRVVTDPDAGSYTDIDVDPDNDELER